MLRKIVSWHASSSLLDDSSSSLVQLAPQTLVSGSHLIDSALQRLGEQLVEVFVEVLQRRRSRVQ